MAVNAEQLVDYITRCLKTKLVPMVSGHPGCGKSDIVKSVAKKYNLKTIDIRLSTYDPCDISGLPKISDTRSEFVPFDTFPLVDRDEVPEGYSGWLIFFDEFTSAPLSVQAACYKVILDNEIGNHALHPKAVIVCAGNLSTSGAIVNRTGTAMQSRLVHMELGVSTEAWIKWGNKNNIDYRILAHLQHIPDNLQVFDPKHNDKTFACPRTWAFLSRLITGVPTGDLRDYLPLWEGVIGIAAANAFISHTEVYTDLPDYKDIVANPTGILIPKEPAQKYAVSHMISAYVTQTDIDKVIIYIERMPAEFQVITLQNVLQKEPIMAKEKTINQWVAKYGDKLL